MWAGIDGLRLLCETFKGILSFCTFIFCLSALYCMWHMGANETEKLFLNSFTVSFAPICHMRYIYIYMVQYIQMAIFFVLFRSCPSSGAGIFN